MEIMEDTNVESLQNLETPSSDVSENIKSVDVFNALNLYNEELGNSYKKDGYNPFDDDFVLTEDFTNDILEAKKTSGDIFPESFLEYGNKEVKKHFENAIINDNEILDKLNKELENATNEKDKKQIKKAIIFLKNRNELLKVNILKLKQKDANALKMYIEMFGLDSELSELLKDTFNEKANNQIIVQNMLNTCRFRANRIYAKSQVKVDNTQQTQQSYTLQNEQVKEPIKQAKEFTQSNKEISQPPRKPPIKKQPTKHQEDELTQ